MAKLFFITVILCLFNLSIAISYNINDRIINKAHDEELKTTENSTIDSWSLHLKIDHCIPVMAVKELGCVLSKKNSIFKKLFRSVCEQHQLCYACGFAHSITKQQCNVLALMSMYEICSQNKTLIFSDCLQQRFSAITLLRQNTHRPASNNLETFFECEHQCVFNYLHAK